MLRPRERYTLHGPAPLSDAALLALLIGTGVRTASGSRSAEGIAHDLLTAHDGLDGLAQASVQDLAGTPGCGPARAVRLHAALALGRRLGTRSPARTRITSADDAWRVLRPSMALLQVEELHALYLDKSYQLVAHEALTRGTDDATVVDPCQVFRPAVVLRCRRIIVAHNHPSGDTRPSAQDLVITERLVDAARLLRIQILDHLIVGDRGFSSLAEAGHIQGPSYSEQFGSVLSGPR